MSKKDVLDKLAKPVVFLEPSLVAEPGGWLGHVPLAFWLTAVLKPKIFVELGTHSGNSYSSFCQAVKYCGLPTKCFAVDTWKGDDHCGYYTEQVYAELSAFNESNYSTVSKLIRSTFDQALAHFLDSSIDLLHIDGCHKYEDVKKDFEQWLPKMSDSGIILLHDTAVREREFGVWRFWDEVSKDYAHFDFFHSNGLGVIGVGKNFPEEINWLFASQSNLETAQQIREFFAYLGVNVYRRFENSVMQSEVAKIQADRARILGHVEQLETKFSYLSEQIISLTRQIDNSNLLIADLHAKIAVKDRELIEKEKAWSSALRIKQDILTAMQNSVTWKLTSPFRKLGMFMRDSNENGIAFYFKLVYWTLTLQVFSRMRERDLKRAIMESGLFDAQWYLSKYTDVSQSGVNPLVHYLEKGAKEGRFPNPLFDSAYYLKKHSAVAKSNQNPLVHYLLVGAKLGFDPSPQFSSKFYLESNADVAGSGINPLAHYLKYGKFEGRKRFFGDEEQVILNAA